MDDVLIRSIEGKKKELDRNRPLNPSVLRKLEEEFSIAWTYNSNAIEGNTLSIQETELVIKEGITIGGKTVNEHLEVLNHKKGIEYLQGIVKRKSDLSEEIIKEMHRIILSSIDEGEAGHYRRTNVRIVGAHHLPPQSVKIPRLMQELIEWYHGQNRVLPVPEMAAALHYRFVMIHPFIDGNGRVARLLMNLYLMWNGYPPAIILRVDRKKYYRVLNEANLGKNANYENFIGRSIERSLILYLNSIEPDQNDEKMFISLRKAAEYCDFSQEYLSLLARKGKLAAVKINRNWMTTREAVLEYVNGQKGE
ncbi:MAG: Fic family protein [Spirochaetales bacterium]|nr:Fic family protein [Spirochaetales bacterium]